MNTKIVGSSLLIRRLSSKMPESPAAIAGLGKKVKKLLAEGIKKKTKVDVEKDTRVLITEVCGTNLFSEGGENIKIKSDNEYPDWLWKMPLGTEIKLQDMNPDSKEYWNKVNYLGRKQKEFLKTLQKHKTLQK